MMDYKVLIKLYAPEIEQSYDVYIPVNKSVGQVLKLLNKIVNSESLDAYPIKTSLRLINKHTFRVYNQTEIIRQTDIKNGTELVII